MNRHRISSPASAPASAPSVGRVLTAARHARVPRVLLALACAWLWAGPARADLEPLHPFRTLTVRGGFVAGATCVARHPTLGPSGGTITLAGIPPGATIVEAWLYYSVLTTAPFAPVGMPTINGTSVPTISIGTIERTPCFPEPRTGTLRADASSVVTGNGTYELAGLPFGSLSDPVASLTEGATLVAIYCAPGLPARDIVLYEGVDVTNDVHPGHAQTLQGFQASAAPVDAQWLAVIGNGQDFGTVDDPDPLLLNGTDMETLYPTHSVLSGSLCPPDGLYDLSLFDVSALIAPGSTTAQVSLTSPDDCYSIGAYLLSVSSSHVPTACGVQCADTVGPDITCSAQVAPCPGPPVTGGLELRGTAGGRSIVREGLADAGVARNDGTRVGTAHPEATAGLEDQTPASRRARGHKADRPDASVQILGAASPGLMSLPRQALSCPTPCTSNATLEADNPYYEAFQRCDDGAFTARTGNAHSVSNLGFGKQDIIWGDGGQGTTWSSDVTFHVHNTGANFLAPTGGMACAFDPPDTPAEPNSVGLEGEWTVSTGGLNLRLREEVVAFGSTEVNAGVRLTLGVTNLATSSGNALMGVRFQIDLQNADDDGPVLSNITCSPFSETPPRDTEHEFAQPEIKDFYRLRNSAVFPPQFSVYTNTTQLVGFPDTRKPDRLVYADWSNAFLSPWNYTTNEGLFLDDSSSLYYFGYAPASGIQLAPGQSFTRSVLLFTSTNSQTCGGFVPGTGQDGAVTICPGTCASAGATATDDCSVPSVALLSSSAGAPACAGNPCTSQFDVPGDYVYTWRATDGVGNQTTCTSTIHVRQPNDPACNQPPVCNVGGPYSSTCRSAGITGAFVSDADEDPVTFTWTSANPSVTVTPASGTIAAGPGNRPVPGTAVLAAGTPPCNQSAVLTLTVNDGNGGTSTCVGSVTFNDTIAPTLANVPPSVTVECNAVPPPAIGITASDNCDPSPAVTFAESHTDGSCPDNYTLTRTWTATDQCGNTVSLSQAITVRDTIPPTINNLPANLTVECDAVPPPPPNVTVSDNCAPSNGTRAPMTETRTNGACPDSYTLTRTWTADDRCGNTTSVSRTVTVRDTTAPVLANVPPSVTAECSAVPPPAANVTASDNCDPLPMVTFAETRANGPCADTYTLTRTWTATDRCGNVRSQSQTVTVRDTTAPLLLGVPPGVTVACDAVPPPATVTTTDNCDPAPAVTFAETRVDGSCAGNYTLTRTWTATDRCGNASSASQTVTVEDTTPPVVAEGGANLACLWPPNHKYVCFRHADFAVTATDSCSDPVTWRFAGCASDQCDDAPCRDYPGQNGDGSTTEDCVVAPDGEGFCVRSERAGTNPEGRHYAVSVIATDACGNASAPPAVLGYIYVPHDQSPHEGCIKP